MRVRVTVNVERLKPNNSVGEGVKVSYIYTDCDKSIIDRIEEDMKVKITDTSAMEMEIRRVTSNVFGITFIR